MPKNPPEKEVQIKVPVSEFTKISRVVQLATLKIYHQKRIEDIDRELKTLLEEDVNHLDY